MNPGAGADGPRQLGYFPEDSIERIREIQRLKRDGASMSEIAAKMAIRGAERSSAQQQNLAIDTRPAPLTLPSPPLAASAPISVAAEAAPAGGLRVTIEDIPFPAYMVNHSFELCWYNEAARQQVFPALDKLPPTSEGRSLFRLLAAGGVEAHTAELLRFHVGQAKSRLTPNRFADSCHGVAPEAFAWLQRTFAESTAETAQPVANTLLTLGTEPRRAYVSVFREGIFVVLMPETHEADSMLEFLARRDEVIRSLLQRRMPVLTNLAVLVADLQGSVRICSELPPDEYFNLINDIWAAMAPIFRKYHGTHGKHVGDGMVYYFFPQPDSDFLFNALACASEIREEMKRLSKRWQLQKNWLNELYLNTGITEGQEWLGTFRSTTTIEFVVLGDTINQAARISDFARFGSIWATKSLIGKLSQESRDRVRYGVRRNADGGREVFVPSSFATVASLVEANDDARCKLRDISTLPIAEVMDIGEARSGT
ncbi:MAG: adenylate/guanylate cyclase domain-containing protein [Gammaproteobacteria bacterium]|nr:adenylate/guanylate cyclase domain-containing protein [Gammaproteobacteria bacterium]MBU1646623.1 adenylate/guanylate cyclase domain-containing protein [Gammaproteobacteria bacterium]MBU1972880.1 adenylate/guanylate cyclase domain-containing protein [Gammaproteobacteria bacterium]